MKILYGRAGRLTAQKRWFAARAVPARIRGLAAPHLRHHLSEQVAELQYELAAQAGAWGEAAAACRAKLACRDALVDWPSLPTAFACEYLGDALTQVAGQHLLLYSVKNPDPLDQWAKALEEAKAAYRRGSPTAPVDELRAANLKGGSCAVRGPVASVGHPRYRRATRLLALCCGPEHPYAASASEKLAGTEAQLAAGQPASSMSMALPTAVVDMATCGFCGGALFTDVDAPRAAPFLTLATPTVQVAR
jgi:hypothetical protein